jgi:hypothetical protein
LEYQGESFRIVFKQVFFRLAAAQRQDFYRPGELSQGLEGRPARVKTRIHKDVKPSQRHAVPARPVLKGGPRFFYGARLGLTPIPRPASACQQVTEFFSGYALAGFEAGY